MNIGTIDRMYGGKATQKVKELSSSELRDLISQALKVESSRPTATDGPTSPGMDPSPYTYVSEVFPHKQSFVYSQGGKNWMRSYGFDRDGNVTLKGDRKETRQRWVEASAQNIGVDEGTVVRSLRRKGEL